MAKGSVGDMLQSGGQIGADALAQIGGGALGAIALATAAHSGNLFGVLAQRQKLLGDPQFRASLQDSPFASAQFGVFGGRGPVPVDTTGVLAPGSPPATKQAWIPNLPALPAGAQQFQDALTAAQGQAFEPTITMDAQGRQGIVLRPKHTFDWTQILGGGAPGGEGAVGSNLGGPLAGMGITGANINPSTGGGTFSVGPPPNLPSAPSGASEGQIGSRKYLIKPDKKAQASAQQINNLNAAISALQQVTDEDFRAVLPSGVGGAVASTLGLIGPVTEFRAQRGNPAATRLTGITALSGIAVKALGDVGNLSDQDKAELRKKFLPGGNDTVPGGINKRDNAIQLMTFIRDRLAAGAGADEITSTIRQKITGAPSITTTGGPPTSAPSVPPFQSQTMPSPEEINNARKVFGIPSR